MSGEYLKIENIGRIKEANVKLDGLNIITGKNDTGKSTVGKLIFSIVKAISRYEDDFQNNKVEKASKSIEFLFFRFVRDAKHHKKEVFEELHKYFYPVYFIKELKSLLKDEGNEKINESLNTRKNYIKRYFTKQEQEECLKAIEDIRDLLLKKDSKGKQIMEALNRAFTSEFHTEISPKTEFVRKSSVSYHSINKLIEVIIEKDKARGIVFDDKSLLLFNDATYIESPMYLQLSNLIDSADTLFDFDIDKERRLSQNLPKISLHIKDLINKLKQSQYFADDLFNFIDNLELLSNISSIIEGEFIYNSENSDFEFENRNKKKLKTINTASGVKSFGILQLLLQSGTLNERSLLIIDEPENHLHPEWQVKYANVITELIKSNISVIINSHSPYMIQALNHFAKEKGIVDKTRYYLTESVKDTNMVAINDVSGNIDCIFRTLAEPINEIMW